MLLSLFGPWSPYYSDVGPSLDFPSVPGWEILLRHALGLVQFPRSFGLDPRLLLFLLLPIGGLSLVLYSALSLLGIFSPTIQNKARLRLIVLGFAWLVSAHFVFALVIPTLWPPLWGYWVAAGGLLVCTIVEAVELRSSPRPFLTSRKKRPM
jgi:hypothetical protein